MRKIKKINGYLVVKFNDREKREYEGTALGEYGVIDAELYTGHLDIDRGAMEYDDAGTLEEAIELARGLESEVDISNEPPTYTVIVESNDTFSENEVEPQLMIDGWEHKLANQIKSRHYPDTDERTAAHELYGYKVALYDLGFLSEDECFVNPDTFGKYEIPTALPRKPEELLAYICDKVCKERTPGRTQPELDAICAKCAIERLASEESSRELQAREKSTGELNKLIDELRDEKVDSVAKRLEFETSGFIRALVASKTISEQSGEVFIASLSEAIAARGKLTEKDTFRNLDPKIRNDPFIRRLYSLGLALERECPENDCTIYRNVFQKAQELDDALDDAAGHPAFVLRKDLREQVTTLREMYRENYAVGEYLRRCGHDRA